jgi:hypothetical protein
MTLSEHSSLLYPGASRSGKTNGFMQSVDQTEVLLGVPQNSRTNSAPNFGRGYQMKIYRHAA